MGRTRRNLLHQSDLHESSSFPKRELDFKRDGNSAKNPHTHPGCAGGRLAEISSRRSVADSSPPTKIDSQRRILDTGVTTMTCHELADRIEKLQPEAMPRDVARLCLLLTNYVDDIDELTDEERLSAVWREMGIRLQAATDQHAAMTAELEELAESDPKRFNMDQIWILIRAIKVQSQVLQLYVGQPVLDV